MHWDVSLPDVLHEGDDIEVELFRQLRLAIHHQALQVVAMVTQELEDGGLSQTDRVTDVQSLQVVQLTGACQLIQDLREKTQVKG